MEADGTIRPTLRNHKQQVFRCLSMMLASALIFSCQILCCQILCCQASASEPAQSNSNDASRVSVLRSEDATLYDVQFIDPDLGWAVGSSGVILHTRDGGESWSLQPSLVPYTLQDVCFVNSESGYVVGGWYEPDTGLSRGLILRTSNGGKSWTPLSHDLPWLRKLLALADGTLVASGDWSPVFLSSVFVSHDRGLSWQAADANLALQSNSISLLDAGLLATDQQGVLFSIPYGVPEPRAISTMGGSLLMAANDQSAIATTPEGGVIISRDFGRTWIPLNLQLPFTPSTACVSPTGEVWLAGTPGDRILKVDSRGMPELFDTGVNVAIRAIYYLDQNRGWAVGGFGMILTTRDGGRTWRPQRPTAKRAMVLGVSNQPVSLPWPILAGESLEQGRRIAVATAQGSALASASASEMVDPLRGDPRCRTLDAIGQIGGGEAMTWNSQLDPVSEIEQVLQSCRPYIVILGDDLTDAEVEMWLSASVRNGAARVFQVTSSDRCDLTILSSAVLPVAGSITGDLWAAALDKLGHATPVPDRMHVRRRWDASGEAKLPSSISENILGAGSVRTAVESRRRNIHVLAARSSEQAMIDRLLRETDKLDDAAFKQGIEMLVNQTPEENRLRLLRTLWIIANTSGSENQLSSTGQLRLLRTVVELISQFAPQSSLARVSSLRSTAMAQSLEWERAYSHFTASNVVSNQLTQAPVASHRSPFERDDNLVIMASATSDEMPFTPAKASTTPAVISTADTTIQPRVLNAPLDDLAWNTHPAILFWKSKPTGQPLDPFVKVSLEQLGQSTVAGPWQKLVSPTPGDVLTAPAVAGRNHADRPILDGYLDDSCWTSNPGLQVGSGAEATTLQMAYEEEFIYFAITTTFASDQKEKTVLRRERDAPMNQAASVTLELDVDRDLLTAFQLSVDVQGRTRDTCDGFTLWQPKWFVATRFHLGTRIIEAAVRREDLSLAPPTTGQQWMVRLHKNEPSAVPQKDSFSDPSGWKRLTFE